MNARYWPCLGVKTGRESLATRFIVALDSGGSAMNIRYRVELSAVERARLTAMLSGGLAERQIAEFVDDDDVVARQHLGQPAAAAGSFLLVELIDQIDQVEEPSSGSAANDR